MKWRWSEHLEGHFEIQCPHMVELWKDFEDIDPDDFPWATIPLGPQHWTINQKDPLTVTPSILTDCGCHGFITNGEWVAC